MSEGFELFFKYMTFLAVVIAFYSLAAQEKRLPCVINSLYAMLFLFYVFSFIILIIWVYSIINNHSAGWEWLLGTVGMISVLLMFIGFIVLRDYHRFFGLRDYGRGIQNLIKLFHRRRIISKNLEYFSNEFIQKLANQVDEFKGLEIQEILEERKKNIPSADSISLMYEDPIRRRLDASLIKLAAIFLEAGYDVQYLSCTRHPFEFFKYLETYWNNKKPPMTEPWNNVTKQIVLLDAHTNHFGFSEPIYHKYTKDADSAGALVITSKSSFAGIHSALVRGYEDVLKAKPERALKPTLLIYDCCSALIDIESERLYRIFIRHVVPSERLLGGNFTIFVEQQVKPEFRAFLNEVCDLYINQSEIQRETEGKDNV